MKKIFALLMAMLMLAGFTCAVAEEEATTIQNATPEFDVTTVVPEGYQLEETRYESTVYLLFTTQTEGKPDYIVSIAHSEEYDGLTLNELSDEEKEALLVQMSEDFAAPEVHDLVTESGTQVYLINETVAEGDDDADASYATGFTIYKGYFFQIAAIKDDFDVLSQEEIDLAMKILSDIWFVE